MFNKNSGQAIINFEDISVRYRVPRERLSGIKEYTIRWLQRRLEFEEFWALNNISFEVQRGEAFGVIGRNGAGKSTLLKVMARVLQPTTGRVVMQGSIAPLLELGGGFHSELVARENIYLNMALLGHNRHDTDQLIDSIVEFAEISDFIDAPLRTYSTGMVARLGFAVATSARPDILLIDEVLSVGDSQFQKKCLDRMRSFRDQGTTIVIVSHSMSTIESFCDRAMLLKKGQLASIGKVSQVIEDYIQPARPIIQEEIVSPERAFIHSTSDKPLRFARIPASIDLYPARKVFDPQAGSFTTWLKFNPDHKFLETVIFHTEDSRYVLYLTPIFGSNADQNSWKITARAGGNQKVTDPSQNTYSFPEVSYLLNQPAQSGQSPDGEGWYHFAMTWSGYPEGSVNLYVNGHHIDKSSYNNRYNDGRELPATFAIGMRPSLWAGEIVENDRDGSLLDMRPNATMSIHDTGLSLKDLRLYNASLNETMIYQLYITGPEE